MLSKNLLISIVISLFVTGLQAQDIYPDMFEANYILYSNDMKIGKMKRTLIKHADNVFEFISESEATGLISFIRNDSIIEKSKWIINENKVQPLTYSYEHTGGKKDRFVTINFDWNNNRIENIVNNDTWHMDTQPDILDKLLYQVKIMLDLKNNNIPESYTIADGGKIKDYEFEYLRDEMIDTLYGEFKTMKIERRKENNERKTWFWCAYDLNYLPVKVVITEKKDRLTTAILKDVTFTNNSLNLTSD